MIPTLFDRSNTDPHDRSVRNVANAGSSAEQSDPCGIDEAFSKVHTGVLFRGDGIPRDETVQYQYESGLPVAC